MSEFVEAATKGALEAVGNLGKELIEYLRAKGVKELDKLSVSFETGFRKFLDRSYRKYSKIKTLLDPSKPTPLESAFESPNLKFGDDILDEDETLDLLEEQHFLVITGLGGSGKSIFVRHIFIRYYNEARGRIPFLVELRNKPAGVKLYDYIFNTLNLVSPKFDHDLFEYALRSGKFLFLIDGFDEIDFSSREGVAGEIVDLSYAYGENLFVVTSRPDNIFSGWEEFYHAEMEGFTREQVVSLVSKVRYDRQIKRAFIKVIKETDIFITHKYYLSNPLLCNIMLLTFDQGAEIPKKMHLFFSQTFDVLFYRHDATKGAAFRRKFRTSLAIDDFRSALAAFSAFSYIDFGPTMKRAQAITCCTKGLEYFQFKQDPSDLLSDLCSSVSILIMEGDDYSYIHRTFQEYFVAVFPSDLTTSFWRQESKRFATT